MPDIGIFHPQIVHFVVALLIIGVAARVVSLLPLGPRFAFVGPMAATLIVLGTLAALAAVHSGLQAHGVAERIPGARNAVQEHEEAGEWVRNVFIGIALLELIGLALASRKSVATALRWTTAVLGLAGIATVYRAADLGGDVVYEFAGGVGTRSGDSTDVKHLLVAGLYHDAQLARKEGHKADAARLTDELARQMPDDADVRFLEIESRLKDRDDARGALADLAAIVVKDDDRRMQIRRATLRVQAYRSLGAMDSAKTVLADLKQRFPNDPRVAQTIERLTGGQTTPR
ncbi:MAG: hypothetical protein HYR74_00680 [Candidatus Eisenbacteria bacterium]|nr:hypothetical protein [Candidatus Eisenbacteria bacterium]